MQPLIIDKKYRIVIGQRDGEKFFESYSADKHVKELAIFFTKL